MNTLSLEENSAIEEEISTIVIELYDTISLFHENHDQEAVHAYIESYIKRVTRLGFRLAKSNFSELRDSCVIYHQILDVLNKRKATITEEQFLQFEVWPTLILAYVTAPEIKDNIDVLIDFLQDPIWNYPVDNTEINNLKEGLYSRITNNSKSVNNITTVSPIADTSNSPTEIASEMTQDSTSGAFDGAVFESIQSEIVETMSSLISDLSSIEEDDDFGISDTFDLCADRIELLGISIATTGLMGLMDVCMIFQAGLRELSSRDINLSEDEQVFIEEWTSHLIAYLSNPTDQDIIDQLVDYLLVIPWADPMSEDESMTLRLILLPEDIEVTAPVEDNNNYKTSEESNESELSLISSSVNEDEIEYKMENTEELDEISLSEDMYFLGRELIQLIHDEFELEQSALDDAIKNIKANTKFSESNIEQLSKFKSMIERFSMATESIGLTGLNKVLNHLFENLNQLTAQKTNFILNEDIVAFLKKSPKLALNYLNDLESISLIKDLISPFYINGWPEKITHDYEQLVKEMYSPRLVIEDDIEIRATQATLDDVSLKLPGDVNQQLLSTLLQELPVQTAEFTQSITQLIEGNASLKEIEKAQRIAHTLKGAANTVGVVGIATLTHHIEDIFNAFTNLKRLPGKKLADILMNAADVLEMMSESLLGLGEPPEQAQSVLQKILDWANLIDQEGIPEDDSQIELNIDDDINTSTDTSHLAEIVAPTMLRIPATLMDELLRIAGESIILGGQLQERLRKAKEKTQLVHEQNTLYQHLVFELEQIVDVQGFSEKKSTSKKFDVFDSLELEQYNELHTVTHQLVEAATDSKELTHSIEDELNKLDTLLVDQSLLHKENQNTVMQTRMVPVQNIAPRLQRSIRQTSRSTNKKVLLHIEGSETLMDSDILNELVDPIMHVLRNAIDHGIEVESVRESKGKDLTGNINLSFFRDGDHIVVRCIDDGAGLDFNAIRTTAIKKKFITSDQNLTENELIRLLWIAGFTTKKKTTQVSGRGIGMDAVYNQITSMKGSINITSDKDIGCTVEIRLPLTLISIHAILTKLRKQTIAVSNRGIDQILSPGDGKLIRNKDKYNYHINDDVYSAFDIETLLHQPCDQRNNDREERSVFIVSDETGLQYAVSVENVIANQDLIVKQLGTYIPDIIGIEGATILGDGSVAPVLDLPGLIRTAQHNSINPLIENRLTQHENIENNLIVLIVDDSLSARRSLAEFVKDIGYDVRMARDGIEAIEVIDTIKPDIILVDLEMPRMNGLELTSHVRSKEEINTIPIIMITSRSTKKHREMADSAGVNAYLTKPFSEDELLENIQNLLLMIN